MTTAARFTKAAAVATSAGVLLGALAVATPAAQAARPTANEYTVDEEALPFGALPGATAYWGVRHGAGWRIEVPDDWNGDLVLYAHGFVPAENPVLTVQSPSEELRAHLVDNGYAWAASSYRANGYVPGLGATDTYELGKVFAREAGRHHEGASTGNSGRPDSIYLVGASMGGHVVGRAIEKWPNAYVGAMPVCGVMGDNELFDYFMDVYVTAETLVGNTPTVPSPPDYATVGSITTRDQLGPNYPSVLNDAGERFKQIIKNRTGGERPAFEAGWLGFFGGNFIFSQALATEATENVDTVYRFTDVPEPTPEEKAFNDEIARFAHEPSARNPRGIHSDTIRSPSLRGDITVPVLTMHTLGELFVPFSMQQIYAERVADEGRSDLLVQRAIRSTAHCDFTAAEVTTAFDDLVEWVEDGARPAGDDVLDPDTVADPSYGCTFTDGQTLARLTVPPCP